MQEIIRKIDIFTGLDDKLLRKLADTAIICTYGPDEVVIREGEMGIGMYFVLRGRVAVVRSQDGAEQRLAEIGADQFFAEMALIDEKPRSASVVTVEATECLLFTRDTFLRLVEKHPALSLRLARVLAERLRTAQERPAEPAPVPAAANGAVATALDAGMKSGIQKKLIETFEMLYTLKAFARFSVAILGCPVEGSAPDALETIRLGDVKAVILPADGSRHMVIEAYAAGEFQLHVFQPGLFEDGKPEARRFDPVAIQPNDRFTLLIAQALLTREPPQGRTS